MTKGMAAVKVLCIALFLAVAAWLFAGAATYNDSRAGLCESNGLKFGSEFMGKYGCIELHPFEEFETKEER